MISLCYFTLSFLSQPSLETALLNINQKLVVKGIKNISYVASAFSSNFNSSKKFRTSNFGERVGAEHPKYSFFENLFVLKA